MHLRSRSPTGFALPSAKAHRPLQCTRFMSQRQKCSATPTSSSQLIIPHELPLFPVQPVGVFLPGMTRTLHLYEPHFLALLDEALASPHRLMATAVLEPYMGDSEADLGPGSFVGGLNFALSCGCLVQVLSAKPYTGGYLVRIRGEGRLGISGLPQTGPYMRAQVYPLPDEAPGGSADEMRSLAESVEQLREVMRDVQNLASKFRCDETAALQQAMRWLYGQPLAPGIEPRVGAGGGQAKQLAATRGEATCAAGAGAAREASNGLAVASTGISSDGAKCSNDSNSTSNSSSSSSSSQDGSGGHPTTTVIPSASGSHIAAVSSADTDTTARDALRLGLSAGLGATTTSSSSATAIAAAAAAAASPLTAATGSPRGVLHGGPGPQGMVEDEEEGVCGHDEELDLEEAVRLSWASLQWLPHAGTEERMYLVRTRLLAADTRQLATRLQLALQAMGAARASLAAKCALKGAG